MRMIPWIGGRGRLVGAAALSFTRPPAWVEALNGVNDKVFNLYRVVGTTAKSS